MPLKEYNKKRDFNLTDEPEGVMADKDSRPFVVQLHYASSLHYDLRLAYDGVLKSWAVPKGPSFLPKDKRLAIRTEDHPMAYKDFEGVIPEGEYGGGTMLLWDRGIWESLDDVEEGLKKGKLGIMLYGERLKGRWTLLRMNTKDKNENWLLIKGRDEYAKDEAGIFQYQTSILSGLNKEEMEEKENG